MCRHVRVAAFAEGCRRLQQDWAEVDGCVVPPGRGMARRVRKMLKAGGSRRDVERLFNHQHLSMVLSNFDCDAGETWEDEDLQIIAAVLAAIIERSLRRKFPEKVFTVNVVEEEDDIRVVCYQERPE